MDVEYVVAEKQLSASFGLVLVEIQGMRYTDMV